MHLRCKDTHGKCNGQSRAFFMVLTCTFDTNISSIFLRAPQYPTVRNASLNPIALGSPDTQCTPGSLRCKGMVCTPTASFLHLLRTEKMSHMHRRTGEAPKWCGGMGYFTPPHHVVPHDLHLYTGGDRRCIRCIWKLLCTFGARITITMHLWCKGLANVHLLATHHHFIPLHRRGPQVYQVSEALWGATQMVWR